MVDLINVKTSPELGKPATRRFDNISNKGYKSQLFFLKSYPQTELMGASGL